MARKKNKRNTSSKKSRKNSFYFGWWLFVLLLFIFLTFGLAYLGKHRQYLRSVQDAQKNIQNEIVKKTNKVARSLHAKESPKKKNSESFEYEIAIAKVQDYAAADSLKAKLSLLGFVVNITPVVEVGNQLYEVSIGPYKNKRTALADLERLKQNEISGILRKLG